MLSPAAAKQISQAYYSRSQLSPPDPESVTANQLAVENAEKRESLFLDVDHPLDYLKVALMCLVTLGIGTRIAYSSRETRTQKAQAVAEFVALNRDNKLSDDEAQLTQLLSAFSLDQVKQANQLFKSVVNMLAGSERGVMASIESDKRKEEFLLLAISDAISLVIKAGTIFLKTDGKLTTLMSFGDYLNTINLNEYSTKDISSLKKNLHHLNLTRVNFESFDLKGANLRGSDMRYSNLSSADMTDANLRRTDLGDSNCDHVVMRNVDLHATRFNQHTSLNNATITPMLPEPWTQVYIDEQVENPKNNLFTAIRSISDENLRRDQLQRVVDSLSKVGEKVKMKVFNEDVLQPALKPYWKELKTPAGNQLRAPSQYGNNYNAASLVTMVKYKNPQTNMEVDSSIDSTNVFVDTAQELQMRAPGNFIQALKDNGYEHAQMVKANSADEYEKCIQESIQRGYPLMASFLSNKGLPFSESDLTEHQRQFEQYQKLIADHAEKCLDLKNKISSKGTKPLSAADRKNIESKIKELATQMEEVRWEIDVLHGAELIERYLPVGAYLTEFVNVDIKDMLQKMREHSCVITGYNPISHQVTVTHWRETFIFNVNDLYTASTLLTNPFRAALVSVHPPSKAAIQ